MLENQKKIWITGASSGIGKALAKRFASEGWKVAVSARRKNILEEMASDKNEFSMPFIKSPEFAAEKIFKGLTKSSSFEIHFPKQLTFLLKLFRIMPYKIYLFLIDKFVKR